MAPAIAGQSARGEVDPAKVVHLPLHGLSDLVRLCFRHRGADRGDSFRLLSGTPKVYVKTGDSGNKSANKLLRRLRFAIYSRPVGASAAVVSLRVGTIRNAEQLIQETNTVSAASQAWLANLQATKKQREKQPVFDAKGSFGKD